MGLRKEGDVLACDQMNELQRHAEADVHSLARGKIADLAVNEYDYGRQGSENA